MSIRESIGERADWPDIAARLLVVVVILAIVVGAIAEAVRA